MSQLYEWIIASAMSPIALVVVFMLCMIDGFFPPVPSESVVTALAAVYAPNDPIRLIPLVLLAALGAFCGDNIAYFIGGRLHPVIERRWPDLAARIHAASLRIEDRGAMLIIPARFIPVGRVFVNMGAGLAEFPHRRFMAITALSGLVWATYGAAIGVAAGSWFHDNPILGISVGICLLYTSPSPRD